MGDRYLRKMPLRIAIVLVLLGLLTLSLPAQVSSPLSVAQDSVSGSDGQANGGPATPQEITQKIEELKAQRQDFRAKYAYPPKSQADKPLSIRRVQLIYEADNHLGEYLNSLTSHLNLLAASRTVDLSELRNPEKVMEENDNSVSLELLDQLYSLRESLQEQKQIIETEVKRLDPKLSQTEKQLATAEAQLRNVREGKEEALHQDTEETAELAVFAAELKLELARQQSRSARMERDIFTQKIEFIETVIKNSRDALVVSPERKEELIAAYEQKGRELQVSLIKAQERLNQAENELEAVPTDADNKDKKLLEKAASEKVALNQAWIKHHHLLYQYTKQQISLYKDELAPSEKLALKDKVETELEQFSADIQYLKNQLARAEEQLEQIAASFESEAEKKASPTYLALWEIADSIQQRIWSAESVRSKLKVLNDELAVATQSISWSVVQEQIKFKLIAFWDYELFVVNERAFPVSKLFWVLLLISLGFILSGHVSRLMGGFLVKRTGAGSGASAAYEKLIYYFLIVFVCSIIFKVFGFSLTSLTVVSGALALAVGFGSQEILKNFISGIILLIERPVHKGDIIEMEGRILRVETIGARSTRVRDTDHTQRIVPNSMLLENVITNWTLSDDVLRSEVKVGVAYGSDTRETSKYLVQAVKGTEGVLEQPEPFSIFGDFGANSLDFSVYFWTTTDTRLKVCSEVRHEIAKVLNDAEIVVSFPQRDVHLDAERPIEISLTRNRKPQED